ncbi:MAG: VanZ family protein [Candidatus Limnocylindrales bacterium]
MFTLTDGYLVLIPGLVVLLPAVPIAAWILRRGSDRRWTLVALLALAHVTAVVALTIFPIPISGQEFYRLTRGMSGDNVVPFATISGQLANLTFSSVRQLSGNLLLLTPLGVYGPELWTPLRDWRRFLAVAMAVGVSIELAQYVGSVIEGFSYRITDVDDAIMNAIGAFLAWGIWRWLVEMGLFAAVMAGHGIQSEAWHPTRSPSSPPR